MKTAVFVALTLLASSPTPLQHPPAPPLSCGRDTGIVQVARAPALRLVELPSSPPGPNFGQEFTFRSGPVRRIWVTLTAAVAEEPWGIGSRAWLTVDVTTTLADGNIRWYRLMSWAGDGRASTNLEIDAERVTACLRNSDSCSYADVSLATPDADVPLLALAFDVSRHGATGGEAGSEARILLDFRGAEPKVAAAIDCDWGSGGGFCDSLDTMNVVDSSFACDWIPSESDFLCRETTRLGHRDQFLLSAARPPLREREVPSVGDALQALLAGDRHTPVVVRDVGPVTRLGEVRVDGHTRVHLLGAPGGFYVVRETAGNPGEAIAVTPHPLLSEARNAIDESVTALPWTSSLSPSFVTTVLAKDARSSVFRVVRTTAIPPRFPPDEVEPSPRPESVVYWVGVGAMEAQTSAEAVIVASEGTYDRCGQFDVPAALAVLSRIRRPFDARVTLQPATVRDKAEGIIRWADDDPAGQCLRNGRVAWREGRFSVTLEKAVCLTPGVPASVRVAPDGKVTLSRQAPER